MASVLDRFRKRRGGGDTPDDRLRGKLENYPFLMKIKPHRGYDFASDYFRIDDSYACILSIFHQDAGNDVLPDFWGAYMLASDLPSSVTIMVFQQVHRMGEAWVKERTSRVEKIDRVALREASDTQGKRRSHKQATDSQIASAELDDGASYLHVHYRLLVKAPDLHTLESAIQKIEDEYKEYLVNVTPAPYAGEQRQELSTLLARNEDKRGRGFHFTSSEYAGSYSLVTNGLNDDDGEFVGIMLGDFNNSAVVVNMNRYSHHVVVAYDEYNVALNRTPVADMVASKLGQAAMTNNGRVVHIILDSCDLDILGPKLDQLTYRINMSHGDVNMFEMFGDREDQMSIFSSQMSRIILMYEQAYHANASERAIIRGTLEELLTGFYINQGMWRANAKENKDRLRVVGLDHAEVPTLHRFRSYVDGRMEQMEGRTTVNPVRLNALTTLQLITQNLVDNNGDLFDVVTSPSIDGARSGRRVIYNFTDLVQRDSGLAMAQLVNIIRYAVSNLGEGDSIIFHGTEKIIDDAELKKFILTQLEMMYGRGGRAVFCYNSVEKMLDDKDFNDLIHADWTMMGSMKKPTLDRYQEILGQQVPQGLESLITNMAERSTYFRRGHENVVFSLRLLLGIDKSREDKRAALEERRAEALRREMEARAQAKTLRQQLSETAQKAPVSGATVVKTRVSRPAKAAGSRTMRRNTAQHQTRALTSDQQEGRKVDQS